MGLRFSWAEQYTVYMGSVVDELWHKRMKQPYKLRKVYDVGDGNKIIVLVHGIGARGQYWQPLVTVLKSNNVRIIVYDLLGFGISPQPDWLEYSVAEHTKSLIKSIDADIGRKRTFSIVGHSMGCLIATHLSATKPARVDKLILYEPPLLIDRKYSLELHKKLYLYLSTRPPLLVNYARLISKYSKKLSLLKTAESWIPIEKSLKNTIISQQTVAELTQLNQETHIIYGRFDFVVSKLDAKRIAQINPNIKLHYVNEMHDISPKSAKFLKTLI